MTTLKCIMYIIFIQHVLIHISLGRLVFDLENRNQIFSYGCCLHDLARFLYLKMLNFISENTMHTEPPIFEGNEVYLPHFSHSVQTKLDCASFISPRSVLFSLWFTASFNPGFIIAPESNHRYFICTN